MSTDALSFYPYQIQDRYMNGSRISRNAKHCKLRNGVGWEIHHNHPKGIAPSMNKFVSGWRWDLLDPAGCVRTSEGTLRAAADQFCRIYISRLEAEP